MRVASVAHRSEASADFNEIGFNESWLIPSSLSPSTVFVGQDRFALHAWTAVEAVLVAPLELQSAIVPAQKRAAVTRRTRAGKRAVQCFTGASSMAGAAWSADLILAWISPSCTRQGLGLRNRW